MTRAVTLAEIADTNTFIVDGANSRVGINSSIPTTTLDVNGIISGDGSGLTNVGIGTTGSINTSGIITATSFVGSGANLTGVSGFATALSTDQTSPLNTFFKTPQQVSIGAGTSVTLESDATSGNIAFIREGIVHVGVGATFHIKTSNTLVTNVLGVFS
jgi:hypothetical protein